jgi:hypothetical protein
MAQRSSPARRALRTARSLALVGALAAASPLAAMTIEVRGRTMTLSGTVDAFTVNGVLASLAAHPAVDTVVLRDSAGGAAGAMIAIAQEIRRRGITTMVHGRCISACAVIFMGGAHRTIAPGAPADETFVAFHGVHAAGQAVDEWRATLTGAVRRLSGGRMPADLAAEMAALPASGYAAFFHPRLYRRADGATVAWCAGNEARKTRDCASRMGLDGLALGVFTR